MSRKSIILLVAGGGVGIFLAVAIPNYHRAHSMPACLVGIKNNVRILETTKALWELENDRLGPATKAFIRDREARGISVPSTVTFSELVSGGYLSNTDVGTFSNAQITMSLNVATTNTKAMLIRVRFADGYTMDHSWTMDPSTDGDLNIVSP